MNHRLMIGCRSPSKLIVLNSDSGDLVAELGISGDPDDLFTIVNGVVSMRSAAPEKSRSSNKLTGFLSRNLPGWRLLPGPHRTFVPERKTLFVAVPHRDTQEAEIRAYEELR